MWRKAPHIRGFFYFPSKCTPLHKTHSFMHLSYPLHTPLILTSLPPKPNPNRDHTCTCRGQPSLHFPTHATWNGESQWNTPRGRWIGIVEQFKKFSQQRLPNFKLSQCQEISLPTTIQQSITSTSKNVCINSLSTIHKCNAHANVSSILKNKSKEQLSLQLISIYFIISLTKMSRKIIKDISWIITLKSPRISSIQKQKLNQSVEWEKEDRKSVV